MKLILFRHGLAVDRNEYFGKDDGLRPLVPKGKERTKLCGQKIKNWLENVDMIVSSPLMRAQQTAEILHDIFNQAKTLEAPELAPARSPAAFAQWLRLHAKKTNQIIAVGHEPHLSTFASWCLAGSQKTFIDLKKSGVICLEFESLEDINAGSALLKWVIHPKMF